MFQFPPCPPSGLCVQPVVTEYCSAGFPHSGISGSTFDDNSPKLIAAIRALLRLLAPRHPPHALSSLIHVRRQHLMLAPASPAAQTAHAAHPADQAVAVFYVLLLFRSVVKVPRRYRRSPTIPGSLAAAPEPRARSHPPVIRPPKNTKLPGPTPGSSAVRNVRLGLVPLGSFPLLLCQSLTCVGLSGLEPLTPALSAQCSNHLSYRPFPARYLNP